MELTQPMIDTYLGGASLRQCGERFNVCRKKLRVALDKAGCSIKTKGDIIAEKFSDAPWRDRDLMLDLYEVQRKSSIEISEQFKCDRSVVTDWLNIFGATMRTTAETQIGKVPGNFGTGKRNSDEMVACGCGCGTQIPRFKFNSHESTFAVGHTLKGAAHPRYKPWSGNKLKKHTSAEYREWRRQVLKASGYTCCECGQVGGRLQSHHTASVAKHPQFMFDVGNGKTMCKPCHIAVHVAFREIFK